jgi:GDP-L-fucose synthase
VFDSSKPDGTPRKLLDVTRLKALGWQASIGLEDGLQDAYDWFVRYRSDRSPRMDATETLNTNL